MAKTPIPITSPLQSCRTLNERYRAVIAIPCCDELDSLPETLKSLEVAAACCIESLSGSDRRCVDQTLIVVNVNQRSSMDRRSNLATLEWLQSIETELHLAWLDHTTGAAAYPEKFGVGLARHQACSSGLPLIDDDAPVISLDADSPVNREYLSAIFDYLRKHPDFKAGHVNFQHRNCGTEAEKLAIRVYEQHLHQHRERLEAAGSPHAWYAIGSTIVCTKAAYLKAGGYHVRRMAGEDFYLLQQLSKTGCHVHMIEDACVYPSDRVSQRVPFGTGKAVGEIVESGSWLTYHPNCYHDLGSLLRAVEGSLREDAETILGMAPPGCRSWLEERGFTAVWPKLQSNARDNSMLLQRFHEWLDAFQTLKLIHYLSDNCYPRIEIVSDRQGFEF